MNDARSDDRLLYRHVDRELSPAEAAAVAARLAAEPHLRERLAAIEALRAGFAAVRSGAGSSGVGSLGVGSPGFGRAPAGFTSSVMAAVRRLPDRWQLEQADVAAAAVRLCRRLLAAALLLAGLGLAWHAGLLERPRAGTMQAAPDEVRREMERLDALIRGDGSALPVDFVRPANGLPADGVRSSGAGRSR